MHQACCAAVCLDVILRSTHKCEVLGEVDKLSFSFSKPHVDFWKDGIDGLVDPWLWSLSSGHAMKHVGVFLSTKLTLQLCT